VARRLVDAPEQDHRPTNLRQTRPAANRWKARSISSELNPVERVWLHFRERFLSHRVLDGYAAVLDAACRAWNTLTAETGRPASLTASPISSDQNFFEPVLEQCTLSN